MLIANVAPAFSEELTDLHFRQGPAFLQKFEDGRAHEPHEFSTFRLTPSAFVLCQERHEDNPGQKEPVWGDAHLEPPSLIQCLLLCTGYILSIFLCYPESYGRT